MTEKSLWSTGTWEYANGMVNFRQLHVAALEQNFEQAFMPLSRRWGIWLDDSVHDLKEKAPQFVAACFQHFGNNSLSVWRPARFDGLERLQQLLLA